MKNLVSFEKFLNISIEVLSIVLILVVCYVTNKSNNMPFDTLGKSDIFYEYSAAVDISNGLNPYKRVLEGDLIKNDKYATLFPLYYYFLLLIVHVSHFSFVTFITNFRIILFLFECVAFLLVYLKFRKANQAVVGFALASYLILNRWTINNVIDIKQDIIAISLLLASLYFLDTKSRLSYLLYGLSLGIKHIGIFIFPIYLIPLIFKKVSFKDFLVNFSLIIVPIVAPAIPFLIDNAKSFFYSMIFSFTRLNLDSDNATYGFNNLLIYPNKLAVKNPIFFILPRIPLSAFYAMNLYLLVTKKLNKYMFSLFSIMIFISFNPVFFDQYLTWLIPFIALSFLDFLKTSRQVGKQDDKTQLTS